jgi:hypothetical protein
MQGASKMLGQISGVASPNQNKKNSSSSFRGTSQQPVDFNSLEFYLLGHLKSYSIQLQFKMTSYFTSAFFKPVKPFATASGHLNEGDLQ